ncbi:MAG TPA: MmcQ/YjbR family DNA-binding protein [Pyrinomonadaceae bacterium]
MSNEHLQRVRSVCNALPETVEKLSHGEPTFFVRKKVFAMFSDNHHNDGHVAVLVPAAIGIQEMLIKSAPEKFYRPAYVGVRGWVGIELTRVTDEELTLHIREGWKLIAPQKLQEVFETAEVQDSGPPKNFVIASAKKNPVRTQQQRPVRRKS